MWPTHLKHTSCKHKLWCPGWVENAKHWSSCCIFCNYIYVHKQNRLDNMEVTMLHWPQTSMETQKPRNIFATISQHCSHSLQNDFNGQPYSLDCQTMKLRLWWFLSPTLKSPNDNKIFIRNQSPEIVLDKSHVWRCQRECCRSNNMNRVKHSHSYLLMCNNVWSGRWPQVLCEGNHCLSFQTRSDLSALNTEMAVTSETLIKMHEATQCHIPEEWGLIVTAD